MNLTSPYPKVVSSLLITERQWCIIRCLMYFDIFNYPLSKTEILDNTAYKNIALTDVEADLAGLLHDGVIAQRDGFYFLPGRQSVIDFRLKVNATAQKFWPKALSMSGLISGFPFVEGVFITGSLAKNCMDEDGDIDYLIITRPGRLWVCRAMLTAYKKIFLLNSRKYFCVNYYVSTDALVVPDENIFTATEITSAVPTYHASTCNKFRESNGWAARFYPNKSEARNVAPLEVNNSATKRLLESFLSGWVGERFDELAFRLFVWRWKKKFSHLDPATFEIN
ncbi:MAG TPA: nucleotidyltransferase domain-containing protein, partial [Bacteroidia bacterium]|nr:nucleotidyltransferase domain-containing protein [Bacteroidia bacterium]